MSATQTVTPLLRVKWVLTATLAMAGCAPPAPAPDVDVAYGDCATVTDGPVCVVAPDLPVRLAVRAAQDVAIEQRLAGRWEPAPSRTDRDAPVSLVTPARDADALRVQAAGRTVWRVALARERLPAALEALAEAARGPDRTALGEAAARLAEYAAVSDAERRGTALGLLARARLRLGRHDEAIDTLRAAIDANVAAGRRLEALRDTNVLVHLSYYKEARYEEVGALYTRLAVPEPAPAEARFFEDYYRGNAALEAGDGREARARLTAAAALARRMGWARRALDADQSLAVHLMQSGQRAQAAAVLTAWRKRGLPKALRACDRAAFAANLGWLALLQREAGEAAVDPTDALAAAQAVMDEHCTLGDRVIARVNLALAHQQARRPREAKAALAEARALTDRPGAIVRMWAHDIEARADLALGDVDSAAAQIDALDALARITLSQDGRWRAAVGAARLARARGEPHEALERYRAADRWLERDLVRLPLGGGRDSLLASRQGARQDRMTLLLELGRHDEALALARRHAAEVLATLDGGPAARQAGDALRRYRLLRAELQEEVAHSWTLAQDDRARLLARSREAEATLLGLLDAALGGAKAEAAVPAAPALGPGVVEIVFFPRADGWRVFLRDDESLRVVERVCANDDDAEQASCLLQPLADGDRAFARVRIVPSGPLWSVDFHAAALAGAPLIERAVVDYALGLGPAPPAASGEVLVVADSRGDLPYAREELAIVRQGLTRDVTALTGRDATSARVLQGLARAGTFHFAGHAKLGGAGGWQSELALASETAIGVADILALPRVPGRVVLSGCETAASAASTAASIGLGQAFLVRGAQAVIAAVRPVDDRTTLALMRAFYAHWRGDGDLAAALAAAQRDVRRSDPAADWAAFRALTR